MYDFIVAGSTDRFGLGENMLPAHKIVSFRVTSVLIFVISISNEVESPQEVSYVKGTRVCVNGLTF